MQKNGHFDKNSLAQVCSQIVFFLFCCVFQLHMAENAITCVVSAPRNTKKCKQAVLNLVQGCVLNWLLRNITGPGFNTTFWSYYCYLSSFLFFLQGEQDLQRQKQSKTKWTSFNTTRANIGPIFMSTAHIYIYIYIYIFVYIYICMLWCYYLGQVWPFRVLLCGPSFF